MRALVLLLAACGGRSAPPSAPVPTEPTSDAAETPAFDLAKVPTPPELCTRARELAANGCKPFIDWPVMMLDNCMIDGLYVGGAQACYLETECDNVNACIDYAHLKGSTYRGPTTDCNDRRRTLPAGMTKRQMDESYGRLASKYSDAPSTREQPIEVCGIPEESVYLRRVTCDDGSQPFADFPTARAARTGNVGPGGRCGRVIDRFIVPCPEKQYEVFIDAYRCPANPL